MNLSRKGGGESYGGWNWCRRVKRGGGGFAKGGQLCSAAAKWAGGVWLLSLLRRWHDQLSAPQPPHPSLPGQHLPSLLPQHCQLACPSHGFPWQPPERQMWAKMEKEKGRMEGVQRLLWLKYGDVPAALAEHFHICDIIHIYILCRCCPRLSVWTPSGSFDAN